MFGRSCGRLSSYPSADRRSAACTRRSGGVFVDVNWAALSGLRTLGLARAATRGGGRSGATGPWSAHRQVRGLGPSAIARATTRFSCTAGDGVSWASAAYSTAMRTQSVPDEERARMAGGDRVLQSVWARRAPERLGAVEWGEPAADVELIQWQASDAAKSECYT